MKIIEALCEITQLDLIPTLDGAFTLKENNRYVHSQRAPLKEASRLIEKYKNLDSNSTVFILWGIGLGYHVELLYNLGFQIIAIETRPKLAKLFKQTFPISKLLGFIEQDETKLFDIIVNLKSDKVLNFIEITMQGIEISRKYIHLYKKGIYALQSSHRIHKYLMEEWYCNILRNLSILEKKNIGYTKFPLFQDQDLVICSAGPSLRESLPYLKINQKNIIILVVDTALQSLLQFGIIPDYVCAIDSKIHNINDFAGISKEILQQITLIADITVNHQISKLNWKNILFTTTVQGINTKKGVEFQNINLMKYLEKYQIHLPKVQTGGSVSNSAFHIGIIYQAERIFLVGQDLSNSNYRGHATGSPYDINYRSNCNRLISIESIHMHKISFSYPVISNKKTTTYTDPLLIQFKEWFEYSIYDNPQLKNTCINATEDGVIFQNWINKPLSKIQFTTKKKNINIPIISYPKKIIDEIYINLSQINITYMTKNELIDEYFYNEKYNSYKEFKVLRKIKRLKKILSNYHI